MGKIEEYEKRSPGCKTIIEDAEVIAKSAFFGFLIFIVFCLIHIRYKYFLDIDTYHFLYYRDHIGCYDLLTCMVHSAGDHIFLIFEFIIVITISVYIIVSCKEKTLGSHSEPMHRSAESGSNAWYMPVFILFSGIAYSHMKPSYIDKDPIIFMLWSMAILLYYMQNKYYFMPFIGMTLAWKGSVFFIAVFYICHFIIEKRYLLAGMMSGSAALIGVYYRFIVSPGITETFNIMQLGPDIELIFWILLIAIGYIKGIRKDMLLMGTIGAIMTLGMIRMNLFALPFMIIIFNLVMKHSFINHRYMLMIAMIAIFGYNLFLGQYAASEVMDDDLMAAIRYANETTSDCLINDWGYGHIYQYYMPKYIQFKGHPGNFSIVSRYLKDPGNFTMPGLGHCTGLFKDSDLIYTAWMMKEDPADYTPFKDDEDLRCFYYKNERICVLP